MEDQGIMALPPGQAMQAPTANPAADAAIAAFDQMRSQVSPKEVGDELLSSAEQADPASVQAFKQALSGLNLPPQIIDALNQMIDLILANPDRYEEIRADLLSQGVPEDFLPPTFDAAFFGALNIAIDQLAGASMPMTTQQFARGGIAELKPIAKMLAKQGRYGDTILAHINPTEAAMLRRFGGAGTTNPVTGLPEFLSFKSVGKAIGGAFKSVGKAIGGVVKGITGAVKGFLGSTVGRIVSTIALGMILGPAAAQFLGVSSMAGVAAISGFIGSAGSTLLAGGSLKDALKSGAVGGLTAGAGAGIMGGTEAFAAGSYTGPTTISGQIEKFTEGLKSLTGTTTPTAPTVSADQIASGMDAFDASNIVPVQATPAVPVTAAPPATPAIDQIATGFEYTPQFGEPVQMAAASPTTMTDVSAPTTGQISSPLDYNYDVEAQPGGYYGGRAPTAEEFARTQPPPSVYDRLKTGYDEYVKPLTPEGIRESGAITAQNAADTARQNAINASLKSYPPGTTLQSLDPSVQAKILERADIQAATAYKSAAPGLFSQYAPIVGAGMGAAYLGGLFNPTVPEAPGIVPKTTGFELYQQNPALYNVRPGGVNTTYAPPSTILGYNNEPYTGSSTGYGSMGNPLYKPTFEVRDPRDYLYQPRGYFLGGIINKVANQAATQYAAQQTEAERIAAAKKPFTPGGYGTAPYRPSPAYTPPPPAPPQQPVLASQKVLDYIKGFGIDASDVTFLNQEGQPFSPTINPPAPAPADPYAAQRAPMGLGGIQRNTQPVPSSSGVGYGQALPQVARPQFAVNNPRNYLGSQMVPSSSGINISSYSPPPPAPQPPAPAPAPQPPARQRGPLGNLFERINQRRMARGKPPLGRPPVARASGGITSLSKYPRKTGQISGPGTETSDSIPAMLSDGEFVMTARAVRGAGGGSRREGAKRMYQMMRKFERKA